MESQSTPVPATGQWQARFALRPAGPGPGPAGACQGRYRPVRWPRPCPCVL